VSRRTETAYKAQAPGKSARHDKTQDSGDMVNAAVVKKWEPGLHYLQFGLQDIVKNGDLTPILFLIQRQKIEPPIYL
jgi:hypothetical protein